MIPSAPSKARTDLETGWTRFMEDRNLKATVPDWETLTAADGSPLLSGRVAGPGAGYALQRFVATGPIGLPRAGDTRPVVDYSVPGRVAYVWRSYGVWVELWVPEAADAVQPPAHSAPGPVGPVLDPIPVAARRAFLRGPGGRLTFTRKRRKETPRSMSIRNVYLDTEFLRWDLSPSGLVSIALVDDQDRSYYAVNRDMDYGPVMANDWMRANVWPFLPKTATHALDREHKDCRKLRQIRYDLAAYFRLTDEPVHLYAYYGAQDVVRLHGLWDGNWDEMPDEIPRWFFDLKALAVQDGNPELPKQAVGAHHPLEDARHNRAMHRFLKARQHRCVNCDGVNPETCLYNPERAA